MTTIGCFPRETYYLDDDKRCTGDNLSADEVVTAREKAVYSERIDANGSAGIRFAGGKREKGEREGTYAGTGYDSTSHAKEAEGQEADHTGRRIHPRRNPSHP